MAIRIEQFATFGVPPAAQPRSSGSGGGGEILSDPRRKHAPHPAAKEAREALKKLAEELQAVAAPAPIQELKPVQKVTDPEKISRADAARRPDRPPVVGRLLLPLPEGPTAAT